MSCLVPTCLRLCASWTGMSISFTKLEKFSFIIFSNQFSISCSSSSPSGTPMIQMLVHLEMSQGLLILSSYIFLNSFFFLLFWLNAYFFLMFHIVDLTPASSPPLMVPCRIFFISLSNLHFFLYVVAILSEFFEHPDHQCFELCI